MSATKQSGYIEISGTGNTLYSMYTDVNDATYFDMSVNGSISSFTMSSVNCNYISLLNGSELTIGKVDDYSFREEFYVIYSSSGRGYITTAFGSTANIYGNVLIDFGTKLNQSCGTTVIKGDMCLSGNDTYQPSLSGNRFQLYLNSNNILWKKLKFQVAVQTTSVSLSIYPHEKGCHDFLIEGLTANYGTGVNTYARVFGYNYNAGRPLMLPRSDNIVLRDISIESGYEDRLTFCSGAIGKIENCNFLSNEGTDQYLLYNSPQLQYSTRISTTGYAYNGQWTDDDLKLYNARKQNIDVFYNNCKFSRLPSGIKQLLYNYDAFMVFKDCEMINPSNLASIVSCPIYYWNSNTMIDGYTTNYLYTYNYVSKCFLLKLTVLDSEGNGIEDCFVEINQSQNKECFQLQTRADGMLYSLYDLDGVLLTNKATEGGSSGDWGTKVYWSDNSNGTYHTVTIEKYGYIKQQFDIVMDADKEATVILNKISTYGSLKIKGV